MAIDPGTMAEPIPANVHHLQCTVEAAVLPQAPPTDHGVGVGVGGGGGEHTRRDGDECVSLRAALGEQKAHVCVCDINAAPGKTLAVRCAAPR